MAKTDLSVAGGWRPIPWAPMYWVSTTGRVWSSISEKELKQNVNNDGYCRVNLSVNGTRYDSVMVHRLVAETFIENPQGKPFVLHRNGSPSDNSVDNLRWGTHEENMRDSVIHGTHHVARRTHCPKGHPYDSENTYTHRGGRSCRTCHRQAVYESTKRGLTPEDPRHGTRVGYAGYGCRCDRCRVAWREYNASRVNRSRG